MSVILPSAAPGCVEQEEFERKRAFFAGSEAVFKLLESWVHLRPNQIFRMMNRYRDMNRDAAMETVLDPEDEQEEKIETQEQE